MRTHNVRSLLGFAVLCILVSLGCSGDTTNPVSSPPAQTFWTLQFDQHAVNLALTATGGQPIVDTIHLHAAALNVLGQPLAGEHIQYRSTDSTVTVDSTGLVTARYVTSTGGTAVVASQTVRGTTLTDTAFVQVTNSSLPFPLATMVLRQVDPVNGNVVDSAKDAVDDAPPPQMTVIATMATGNTTMDTVCNVHNCPLIVRLSSSDSSIATIDQFGYIRQNLPGHVTFYVDTWAYGVTKRDSLPYVIGYPISIFSQHVLVFERPVSSRATPALYFGPDSTYIGVGGWVEFQTALTVPVDIVFDSTQQNSLSVNFISGYAPGYGCAFCAPHSSPIFPNAYTTDNFIDSTCCVYIQFMAPGRYRYLSKTYGTGGTIIVSSGP